MKIYIHPIAPTLMRVNIKKTGYKTENIILCEAEQDEVISFIENIVKSQNINPFEKGYVTNVEVRECADSKNGKSKSISFKGINPEKLKTIILKTINKN
jgi:hypothetical protein